MPLPIIQSAINISEGRRAEVIEAIVEAAQSIPAAIVADYSADSDHNRMVITLLGGSEAIHQAVLAIAREAVARIDLRQHTGAHPRLGAVDVIPLVPLHNITMTGCVELSRQIGKDLADQLALPVYFYEYSAAPGRRAALPDIRRGGLEGLSGRALTDKGAPDLGPHRLHSTAGAVVVGARDPLVAYNILLDTGDVRIAQRIAATIRTKRVEHAELTGVRALGLYLPSQDRAQVSMNLTRPDRTTLPAVFDFVRQEAARHAAKLFCSEVIGLVPHRALDGESPDRILWRDFRETQILEYWLEGWNSLR